MGVYAGPEVVESGLVLALDGANLKSFKGEDTYNYTRNSRDFSGTAYASEDQWADNPSVLSKTYISSIVTPVGNGATLIQESGSNGYHHLSRWGGSGESGAYSLSCYVFPLTSDITDFVIGMLGDGSNQISFNLNTRAITYGPGISNRDAFITPVVGFDGWYRVGANIEGRAGGWVGCIGYTTSSVYTGTSGNKKCYITGIQYELKTKPTMFVEAQTTRGTTVATGGGWADLSGRGNNGELVNGVRESSDNLGALVFDGTNDYVNISVPTSINAKTILSFIRVTASGGDYIVYGLDANGSDNWFGVNGNVVHLFGTQISDVNNFSLFGTTNILTNTWYQIGCTIDGATAKVFLNGVQENSITQAFTIGAWSSSPTIGRRGSIAQRYFPGNIANLQVYDRALTASEIQQNYNATKSRYGLS